jgi:sterol desaturase/sphingolipid hydroxylase (fatty acid hydroxylase superfamily)
MQSGAQEEKVREEMTNKRWIAGSLVLVGAGAIYFVSHDLSRVATSLFTEIVHAVFKSLETVPSFKEHLQEYLSLFGALEFFLLLALVLTAEHFVPVNKTQRLFSVGLRHDVMWFLFHYPYKALVVSFYWVLLYSFYEQHLTFLRIQSIDSLPIWALVAVSILSSDFLNWLHHYLRHKVLLFWYFHTVHHSQREINLFTDFRSHPAEYLIAYTIRFIPFLSLQPQVAVPTVLGWELFNRWYTRFYHANVRTNLGWLRYVLVTPQSHRIHHSVEEKHRDKNFGVIFSIWDRLFGTQYRGSDEYPDTGISDDRFPHENSKSISSLFATPVKQFFYPFRIIVGRVKIFGMGNQGI